MSSKLAHIFACCGVIGISKGSYISQEENESLLYIYVLIETGEQVRLNLR